MQQLQELTQTQLEQALLWLESPLREPLPSELSLLSQVEWFLLRQLLNQIQVEKQFSQLH